MSIDLLHFVEYKVHIGHGEDAEHHLGLWLRMLRKYVESYQQGPDD